MDSTDTTVETSTEAESAECAAAASAPPSPPAPALEPPARRLRGFGVMSPRDRALDQPAPPREVVEQAAATARTTGHRFDLMRYLRLRRKP